MHHEVSIDTSQGRRRVTLSESYVTSLGIDNPKNVGTVALFISSWLCLLADSPLTDSKKPFRLFTSFLDKIKEDGLKETILTFSDLAHKFVSQHYIMGTESLIGPWLSEFKKTPVFFEYQRYYRTGNPQIAKFIYNFLTFGKKLPYEDEQFDANAFRKWQEVEQRLTDLALEPRDIASLRLIMETILPPFSIDDFRPKFGPGAVAEKKVRGMFSKIKNLRYDYLIDRFLFHGELVNYSYKQDNGLSAFQVIPDPSTWSEARRAANRTAKLTFVPKNIRTSRSICMEPNVCMFMQQGILREMVRIIRHSPLRKIIRLEDQTWNQKLAMLGSYTAEIATLDLESASDSLSLALVKGIFPTRWQIAMLATRSRDVELPNKTKVKVKKFAPMGSALCFPVQCLTFTGIAVYAGCLRAYETSNNDRNIPFEDWLTPKVIRSVLRSFGHKDELNSQGLQPLGIYGDDICIDDRLTHIIVPILERLGFRVNSEKSFSGSKAFRESCGVYCLDGFDLTPMYFRIKEVGDILSPTQVASQVHLINSAWAYEYKHLYRFLRRSLLGWGVAPKYRNRYSERNPIPFISDPNQFGIMCSKPRNTHVERREQPEPLDKTRPWYQIDQIRVWTIRYIDIYDAGNLLGAVESYLYSRWWASRRDDSSFDVTSNAPRWETGKPSLRWRWIPA